MKAIINIITNPPNIDTTNNYVANNYPSEGIYELPFDSYNYYCVKNGIVYMMPKTSLPFEPFIPVDEPKEKKTTHVQILELIAVSQNPDLVLKLRKDE